MKPIDLGLGIRVGQARLAMMEALWALEHIAPSIPQDKPDVRVYGWIAPLGEPEPGRVESGIPGTAIDKDSEVKP